MDHAAFHLINIQFASPAMDMAMAALSNWDVWWPLAVVAGAVALTLGGFRARAMLLTAVLAIGVSDGLLCRTLKDVAGRPRPNDSASGVRTVELAKSTTPNSCVGKAPAGWFYPGQKAREARQVIPFLPCGELLRLGDMCSAYFTGGAGGLRLFQRVW
jgi:hypothetical protein